MRKNRHGSAKQAFGQQEAGFRRDAPGKKFIGEGFEQSHAAKEAERQKVERMVEVNAANRTVDEVGMPISAVVAELVQDTVKLAGTLMRAPYRIAVALIRRPREA